MLTAVLEMTDEEIYIAGKIIFAISPMEALKGGVGKSGGRWMNEEQIGGEGPSGAVFGLACDSFGSQTYCSSPGAP